MNILAIATILPIPDIIQENDVVYKLYKEIQSIDSDVEVTFCRPIAYSNALLGKLKLKWHHYYELRRKGYYFLQGEKIHLLPMISVKAPIWLQRLFCTANCALNQKRLKRLLAEKEYSLIHAHYLHGEGVLAYELHRRYGIPYAITIRGEEAYWNNFLYGSVCRKVLKNAACLFTPSSRVYRELAPEYAGKIHLMPHGIESSWLNKTVRPVPKKPIRILTVCRLLSLKYVDIVIDALAELKDKADFTYTLVGDGPEKEHLLTKINALGLSSRVSYIPHVPYEEMQDIFAGHDIFIMPSYPETFGRVYFEAMAMGMCVMCSDRKGISDYVTDGENAVLISHLRPAQIVEKLFQLMETPERITAIGNNAKELVRTYTWEELSQQYLDIYSASIAQ